MNREENPIIAWLEDTAMERGEERGIKKGQRQALQDAIHHIISTRFPALQGQAEGYISATQDPEQLQT